RLGAPVDGQAGARLLARAELRRARTGRRRTLDDLHLAVIGLCQPPSAAMSASASLGPHVPGLYGRAREWFLRTSSTAAHAASTASSRVNRAPSPDMASPSSRS